MAQRRALSRLRRQIDAMEKAWEALDYGVATLGPGGLVISIMPLARNALGEFFDDARTFDRRLPDMVTRWLSAQKRQFALRQVSRPLKPLVVERGEARLVVRLVIGDAYDLLLVQAYRPAIKPARLAAMGLSRREMEVLAWVAEGKTNEEAAGILDMSPRTVQKHLEHIFAKLGVETRTAAAKAFHDCRLRDEPPTPGARSKA